MSFLKKKKRVTVENKGRDKGRRDSAPKSGSKKSESKGPGSVLCIDVGSNHDITVGAVLDALQQYGRVRRDDIGKIDILENETHIHLPAGKADTTLKAMTAANATVDDFLVVCTLK